MFPPAIGCKGCRCGFLESVDIDVRQECLRYSRQGSPLLDIRLGSPLLMVERIAWYRRIKDDFPN